MHLISGARKRRAFQITSWAGIILLTVLTGISCNDEESARESILTETQPSAALSNVLLISLCSVRADHMSCYGYVRDTTPNLRALSREAIIFDNTFTQWPKTAPGFAAIISGKYGHANGVIRITPRSYLDDRHITLTEVLKTAGYDTAAFISAGAIGRSTNIPTRLRSYR